MERESYLRMPPELLTSQAEVLCEDIVSVVQLYELAAKNEELAAQLNELADRLALGVAHRSMISGHLIRLGIELPAGTGSQITNFDEDITVNNPTYFEATDVRKITPKGAIFYNSDSQITLLVRGHDFEVRPVPLN